MDDQDILKCVYGATDAFGAKCSKYAGSVTVEVLRRALRDEGFPTSERDVFIRGVPVEIDPLIPVPAAEPRERILYEPSQVAAVLEVKKSGMFGEASGNAIRRSFSSIQRANCGIACLYVTLGDRENYKWAIPPGPDSFTLFWHKGPQDNLIHTSTGDWQRLLKRLKPISQ